MARGSSDAWLKASLSERIKEGLLKFLKSGGINIPPNKLGDKEKLIKGLAALDSMQAQGVALSINIWNFKKNSETYKVLKIKTYEQSIAREKLNNSPWARSVLPIFPSKLATGETDLTYLQVFEVMDGIRAILKKMIENPNTLVV